MFRILFIDGESWHDFSSCNAFPKNCLKLGILFLFAGNRIHWLLKAVDQNESFAFSIVFPLHFQHGKSLIHFQSKNYKTPNGLSGFCFIPLRNGSLFAKRRMCLNSAAEDKKPDQTIKINEVFLGYYKLITRRIGHPSVSPFSFPHHLN